MSQIIDNRTVRRLAPEDVRVGSYVVPLSEVVELLCRCEVTPGTIVVRRFELTPCGAARVYRVVGVFLPYVLVRDAFGDHTTLDIRSVRLGRVPGAHGKLVRQCLRADKRRKKKGKK